MEKVNIRTQQTISALLEGTIDAGVWNYDGTIESRYLSRWKMVALKDDEYNNQFSAAIIVIKKDNTYLAQLLKKHISVDATLKILDQVRSGQRRPYF